MDSYPFSDLCYCADIKCVARRSENRRRTGEDGICEIKCAFVSSFLLSPFYGELLRRIYAIKNVRRENRRIKINRGKVVISILFYNYMCI